MWQFPIGTVVRRIPTEDNPAALWGHVVGFTTSALDQVELLVDWQNVALESVPPSEVEVAP